MDQLIPIINWTKKNIFWIVCFVLTVAVVVSWILATSTLDKETRANQSKVDSKVSAANGVKAVNADGVPVDAKAHPNKTTVDGMQVKASGDRKLLAAFEGPQAPEVDEHGAGHVTRRADLLLWDQVDVELRARPDGEILLEEQGVLIDRHPARAIVNRVGGIGVDEATPGHHGGLFGLTQTFHRRRWREDVGKEEERQRHTEARAEDPADQQDR